MSADEKQALTNKLFDACATDDAVTVSSLLTEYFLKEYEKSVDDIRDPGRYPGSQGNSLLYSCARVGACKVARVLLAQGASVNLYGEKVHQHGAKSTPLHNAAFRLQLDFLILLCRHGADVTQRNSPGDRAMDDALSGVDPATHSPVCGAMCMKTLLAIQASESSLPLIVTLAQRLEGDPGPAPTPEMIEAAIEVDTANMSYGPCGWTPLHIACATGNIPVIKALLASKKCMTKSTRDGDGWTPLHVLCARVLLVPNDFERLKDMFSLLESHFDPGSSNPWLIPVLNDTSPQRHSLTRRLWKGKFKSKKAGERVTRDYILWVDRRNVQPSETSHEAYQGTLWVGEAPTPVEVLFYPNEFRRVTINDMDGNDILTGPYYVDDLTNELRPLPEEARSATLQKPKEMHLSFREDVFFAQGETLLPCSVYEFRHVWWTVRSVVRPYVTYCVRFQEGREITARYEKYSVEYKVEGGRTPTLENGILQLWRTTSSDDPRSPSHARTQTVSDEGKIFLRNVSEHLIKDSPLAVCNYDDFCMSKAENSSYLNLITHNKTVCIGYTPLCWAIEAGHQGLLTMALERIKSGTASLGAREKLQILSAWLNSRPKSTWGSTLQKLKQANLTINLEHRSFLAQHDTFTGDLATDSFDFTAFQDNYGDDLFKRLIDFGILDCEEAKSETSGDLAQNRRNVLVVLLLKAISTCSLSKVKTVIDVLRIYRCWSTDDLLNHTLSSRSATGTTLAVKVAAKFNRVDVLELIVRMGASVTACHGAALRCAIRYKNYEAAQWLVRNGWKGVLGNFPTHSNSQRLQILDADEIQFCYDNKLLPMGVYEDFIQNCTNWVYPTTTARVSHTHITRAAVVIGLQPRIYDFLRDIAQQVDLIVVITNIQSTEIKAVIDNHKEIFRIVNPITFLNGNGKSYSPFFNEDGMTVGLTDVSTNEYTPTTLETILQQRNINDLILCGFPDQTRRAWVFNAAQDAFSLNFGVTVVQDLSNLDKSKQEEIIRRGGHCRDAGTVKKTTSAQKAGLRKAQGLYSMVLMLGFQGIRLARIFEQSVQCQKILTHLNHVNFGFTHPRAGELYLYFSLLMYSNQNITLRTFSIQGLHVKRAARLRDPLHYLIVLITYGVNPVDKDRASQLLIMAVQFLNKINATVPSYTFPGQVSVKELAQRKPLEPCMAADSACSCIYHANCSLDTLGLKDHLLQENLWSLQIDSLQQDNGEKCFAKFCPVTHVNHRMCTKDDIRNGITQTNKRLSHLLHRTPLELAIKCKLHKVVKAMICDEEFKPLLHPVRVKGRDGRGRRYEYDHIADLWGAVPEEADRSKRILPFHLAVINCHTPTYRGAGSEFPFSIYPWSDHSNAADGPMLYPIQSTPEGVMKGWSPVILSGRQKGRNIAGNVGEEIFMKDMAEEDNSRQVSNTVNSVAVNDAIENIEEPLWRVPSGLQWICDDCGTFVYECYETRSEVFKALRDHEDAETGRAASTKIVEYFIRASTMYSRYLTISDVEAPSVVVQKGGRKSFVGSCVDFTGLFMRMPTVECKGVRKNGESGLSLLFRYAPDLVPLAHDLLTLSPVTSYFELNSLLQDTPGAILIQRRHMFQMTRGGVQILVHDSGLTALQWCALLGDVTLTQWIMNLPDFDMEKELHGKGEEIATLRGLLSLPLLGLRPKSPDSPQADAAKERLVIKRSWLGWTALHYAAYSNSPEVLRLLLIKAPHADFAAVLSNRFDPSLELTNSHYSQIERPYVMNLLTMDPSAYPDQKRTLDKPYGKVNTQGETALHVACMFTHLACAEQLIEMTNLVVPSKTFIDRMDAHDVALAISYKCQAQNQQTLLTNPTERETEDAKADQADVDSIVRTLDEQNAIQQKMVRYGMSRFFFTRHSVYLLFVFILTLYGFFVNNQSLSEVRADYLAIERIDKRIGGSEPFQSIESLAEFATWLNTSFRDAFMPDEGRAVLNEKFLMVSAARISQLRVQRKSCGVQFGADRIGDQHLEGFGCYPSWSYYDINRTTLNIYNEVTRSEFRFNYTNWHIRPLFHSWMTEYRFPTGEGFFIDLRPGNATDLHIQFASLAQFFHLQATRVVISQFTIYSLSLDVFIVCEIILEVTGTGGVYKSVEYTPVPLDPYSKSADVVKAILHIFLAFFWVWLLHGYLSTALYDIAKMLRHHKQYIKEFEAKRQAVHQANRGQEKESYYFGLLNVYVRDIASHLLSWNILDLTILTLLLIMFSFDIFMAIETARLQSGNKTILDPQREFMDVSLLAFAWRNKNNVLGQAILFAWISVLRCLYHLPSVGPMASAIVSLVSTPEVLSFFALFAIILMGFVSCMTLMFGYRLLDYRSMHQTFFRIARLILGDYDYPPLEKTHFYSGAFVFLFLVIFVTIILLNTLVAVLNQVYEKKLESANASWFRQISMRYIINRMELPPIEEYEGNRLTMFFCKVLARCKVVPVLAQWADYQRKKRMLYQTEHLWVKEQNSGLELPHLVPWRFGRCSRRIAVPTKEM